MKNRKKIVLLSVLTLCLCCLLFACGKPDAPAGGNVYAGGADLHLKNWENTDYFIFEGMQESAAETVVPYTKSVSDKYAYIYTPVDGKLADFAYLNLKAKSGSARGRTATVRILNSLEDSADDNILGGDFDIALSSSYETYSLKVKSTFRTRLDIAKFVAIYPDIGKGGTGYRDTLYLADVWFSAEAAGTVANPDVDSGGQSAQVVGGWTNPGWTKYTLYPPEDEGAEAILSFGMMAQDWAAIERPLEIKQEDILSGKYNELKFSFTNLSKGIGTKPSIEHIKFSLKGDYWKTVPAGDGVEYAYDLFYEQSVGSYVLSDGDTVDAPIELSFDIGGALAGIYEHCKDGLRLSINVESEVVPGSTNKEKRDLNGDGAADYDRMGEMQIEAVVADYNERYGKPDPTANLWRTEAWTGYGLTVSGKKTTVAFSRAAEWGFIALMLDLKEGDDTLKFEFENLPTVNEFGSVGNISIKLRGDVKATNIDPNGNAYNEYYEDTVAQYAYPGTEIIDGNIVMEIPIAEALKRLDGHMQSLELVLNIESDPIAGVGDKEGRMTIVQAVTYKA